LRPLIASRLLDAGFHHETIQDLCPPIQVVFFSGPWKFFAGVRGLEAARYLW